MIGRSVPAALAVLFMIHTSSVEAIVINERLTPQSDELRIPVNPFVITSIYLPKPIRNWQLGNSIDYQVELAKNSTTILNVQVLNGAPPTNVNIELCDGQRLSVYFDLIPLSWAAASRVEFRNFEGDGPLTVLNSNCEISADPTSELVVDTVHVDAPVSMFWNRLGYGLRLETGFAIHTSETAMLAVTLEGLGDNPYPLHQLELRNHNGQVVDAEIVHGANMVTVALQRGQRVTAVFRIPNRHLITQGWNVIAIPKPAVVSAPRARFSYRPSDDRGPLEGRLSVSARAYGGFGNLGDGLGNGMAGWTSLQGVGLCVAYGIRKHVSLDACLQGTRTDDKHFADAVWDQDRGELQISETSGQLLAGALIHTAGKRWIPFGKLGLGVRFSNRERSMGSRAESEIRSGVIVGVGGGLRVRFGKRWLATATVNYADGLRTAAETIEAGVHLGATWDLMGSF